MTHKWYAIQVHSGSELAVKQAIENLVKDLKVEDKLEEILVPTEDLIDVKKGVKKIVERSLYPGYVFINIDLDTNLWHRIQSLAKVGRFIGESKKPTQLSEKDINMILEKVNNKAAPRPKIFFEDGEVVRIKEGPFANFNGIVDEYDADSGKLKLNVSIFSRSTPVEIMYNQVERVV